MRIFKNCYVMAHEMDRELMVQGITVPISHYQNKKLVGDDQLTKELIGVSFLIAKPLQQRKEMLIHLFKDEADKIEAYCKQEFQDRISGQSLNPGNSYKIRQDMWQKFMVDNESKFDYCVVGDSLVLTINGYIPIKELQEGDFVFNKDGELVKIKKFISLQDRKILSIKGWRGYQITGTYNHPIMTLNSDNSMQWKILSEITKNDYIQLFTNFPTDDSLDFSNDEAYSFGLIYSDGHIDRNHTKNHGTVSFVNKNKKLNDYLENLLIKNGYSVYTSWNQCNQSYHTRIHKTLEHNNQKTAYDFISRYDLFLLKISFLNEELILSFLKGFLDGDGSYNKLRREIIFCTNHTHPEQINNIQLLLLKLGIISFISNFKTKYGFATYVKIAGYDAWLFDQKIKRYNIPKPRFFNSRGIKRVNNNIFIKVKNIIKQPNENVYDISTDGSFICNHIVSHNTYSERLHWQWAEVIRTLKEDKHTRQAVVEIFYPEDIKKTGGDTRIPCSVTYSFLIRNNRLHTIYYMRSNDALSHYGVDIWIAAEIGQWITEQVQDKFPEVKPGPLIYFCNSFHAYKWDMNKRVVF